MRLEFIILLATLGLATAFPKKGDKDKKQDGKWDGTQPWDGDQHDGKDGKPWDGNQPWDGSRHDGQNRTVCISVPWQGSFQLVDPGGKRFQFDDHHDRDQDGHDGSQPGHVVSNSLHPAFGILQYLIVSSYI